MEPVTPLHVQLRELLREKIEEGCYGQGTMIPSERDLAAAYRINRINGVETFAINNGASDFRFTNTDNGLGLSLRAL